MLQRNNKTETQMFVGRNGDGTWYIEHRTACVLAFVVPVALGLLIAKCADVAIDRKHAADDQHIRDIVRVELAKP